MRLSTNRLFWARTALSVAAASGCCWAASASAAGPADHHQSPAATVDVWDGYQAPPRDASWRGYGADPCGCQPRRPRLILGLLDSVAGGVEQVLGLSGPRSSHCDEVACDDGCDAMTLRQLRTDSARFPQPLYPAPAVITEDQVPGPVPFVPGGSSKRTIEKLPVPRHQDAVSDPFEDEQAGRRRVNPAISPSAYFE